MATSPPSVSSLHPPAGDRAARPDTPAIGAVQGREAAARRMRLRTLVTLRWAYSLGQVLILAVTWRVLRWATPIGPCIVLVGLGLTVNIWMARLRDVEREARTWEIMSLLAFDILQMSGLLYFTGGMVNPFAILLISPVTIAGAALPLRRAIGVWVLAISAVALLAIYVARPPVGAGAMWFNFDAYRLGRSSAIVLAMVFTGAFASWTSAKAARRALALHVTETVLAREQRLSALGALSAAVAHELGTPLATISIIATEMAREAPEGPLRDDAVLLVEQAKRCRDILKRLAETPERQDALHERMSLLQFVREIVEPYGKSTEVRVEALVTGPPGVGAPDVWLRPEILHAITTLVENAFDFARREILLTARFDAASVAVEVRDDGPGFAPEVMGKLGEPYVTTRPGAEGSRTGHVGMGLGVFIAKTLLERSGARVTFANGPRQGAIITARWDRSRIEAPQAAF